MQGRSSRTEGWWLASVAGDGVVCGDNLRGGLESTLAMLETLTAGA